MTDDPLALLTPAQRAIAWCLSEGQGYTEIAAARGVSLSYVRREVARACKGLGLVGDKTA